MKQCIISCTLFSLITLPSNTLNHAKIAVICKSVADLVGEPLINTGKNKHTDAPYKKIPLCCSNNTIVPCCPRIHQALFNEMVTIIKETTTEYCLNIHNTYYVTEKSDVPQVKYWTLKKNCKLIPDISQEKYRIPDPITFQNTASLCNAHVITLTEPWFDHQSHTTFSVGTRFIYLPKKTTPESYAAIFFDMHHTNKSIIGLIPKDKCILTHTLHTDLSRRTHMINILRKWIHKNSHHTCIPYVWGGCSYTHSYTGSYKEVHKEQAKPGYSFYSYPQTHKHTPYPGFDCSGLILRAAQSVGIPFFYKNSYTMQKKLKPIEQYKDIKPGDIIWIPGHVMIIADLARNTIIEARGYPHGYGKVHETPLSEQFKGINTFEDLLQAYHKKPPLLRLNKKGIVVGTIPSYKILQLF